VEGLPAGERAGRRELVADPGFVLAPTEEREALRVGEVAVAA